MKTESNLSIYAESSALAKLYIQEKGSESVLQLFQTKANVFYTSQITLVEISSALYRRKKENEIIEADYQKAKRLLLADYESSLATIAVDDRIIQDAAVLVEKHFLRAYDAVHLASAIWIKRQVEKVQKELGQERTRFIMLTSDDRLYQAGLGEGMEVLDPNRIG